MPKWATFWPLKNAPVNSSVRRGLKNQSSEIRFDGTDVSATCVVLVWKPGAISMRLPSAAP